MSTVVIETPDLQQVPYSYQLSYAQTLQPESVFAHFDGTNASGDFLACLTFSAPDGTVFMRTFPTTPVTGGDVADVTFAPFPGGIGSSPGPSVVIDEAIFSDTVTITGSGGPAGVTVSWLPTSAQTLWDLTTPTNPRVTKTGLLTVTLQVECFLASPPPDGTVLATQVLIPGPVGVFPGVMNLADQIEATANLPAPLIQVAASGLIGVGTAAGFTINTTGGTPLDVNYVFRTDLIEGV